MLDIVYSRLRTAFPFYIFTQITANTCAEPNTLNSGRTTKKQQQSKIKWAMHAFFILFSFVLWPNKQNVRNTSKILNIFDWQQEQDLEEEKKTGEIREK